MAELCPAAGMMGQGQGKKELGQLGSKVQGREKEIAVGLAPPDRSGR